MKNSIFLFCLSFFGLNVFAQENQFTDFSESDPKAKVILDKLSAEYKALKSMQLDFTLTIEAAEEDSEEQKGQMAQKGESYRLNMGGQEIICDGDALWIYFKARNEVQINDVDEDMESEILSPNDLFQLYEKGDYIYALVNEANEKGKTIQQIEFKPIDRESEFTKLRLTIDKKKQMIMRMKVFSKDGSRFTLSIDNLTKNKSFADGHFKFNKADYPEGLKIENLRMD